jgi:hypothetical protein
MGLSELLQNHREFGSSIREVRQTLSFGARLLVPGLTQRHWHQRDRGLVLLISFVSALGASLFCWGMPVAWSLLGFAFLTHAVASLDVLRQRSFPVFPSRIASSATIVVMIAVIYLPLIGLLCLLALPTRTDGDSGTGYLVNGLAYRKEKPQPGQWVWLCLAPRPGGCAGQVIATAGQEVEWTGRRWLVDGKDLSSTHPGTLPYYPESWRFRVPEHHVLVGSEPSTHEAEPSSPLLLVSQDKIVGRAWARYYPFWERCLL